MVKEYNMVSPYFLFFLVHSAQTGIYALYFQRDIIKGAGHEAWISVFVLGLLMHLIFFMMMTILQTSSGSDLISFHRETFGKIIGGFLNFGMVLYFVISSLNALYTYIDVLHIWVFQTIPSWELALLFVLVIYYIVAGGFRVITAIAFWGVVIPICMFFAIFYLLKYVEISYIQPLFQHGLKDHFLSAWEAIPIYLGFENILIFFPFIKEKQKSWKWGHFALLFSTVTYTVLTLITFMFFTQGKLEKLTWPTLTMIKILHFPFLERIEFLFIFTWLLVIMPPICLGLWSAIRIIKLTMPKAKPTFVLIALLVLFYMVNSELLDVQFSHLFIQVGATIGKAFIFGYILLLFPVALVKKRLKARANRS